MTGKNKTLILLISLAVTFLLPLTQTALALPPRPEPTPAPNPIAGGGIELRVQSTQAIDWASVQTLVQWQDGLGSWHDVEGWRGTLDELYSDGGRKTWWMSKEHFGTGPFRWAIYKGDETLATSESFAMPKSAGEVVQVVMLVAP